MASRSRSRALTRLFSVLTVLSLLLITSLPAVSQSQFQGLPNLPVNACNNSSLPRSFGTNFPTPRDPFGFNFQNVSALGWPENWYAVFAFLSGSYFARGVPTTFTQSGTSYCGAMYSFSVYTNGLPSGQQPPAGSVQWTMDNGYLPALTTSWTRNNVAFSIKNFANRVTIGGNPFVLVYTRVRMTNNGSSAVTISPGASGPNLATLVDPSDTIQPGQTSTHDYVAAVDRFGGTQAFPSVATLQSSAPSFDTAYSAMVNFWDSWLATAPQFTLPNITLPNTNNLANPGTALINAYKASFVYVRIFQVGKAPFSAANNYNWLLNHDIPAIIGNRLTQGDFRDAQNLLLIGRISEQPNFNEQGANWYWDGIWKTPIPWAIYLAKTNDTAFVSQFFNDSQTQWGPSLFTMFHTHYLNQLDPATGYLKTSFDNDSTGTWLFDDYSALIGLAAYKYIAQRLGNNAEANFAHQQMINLLNATNTGVAANQSANNFSYLPCEVNRPNSANRCNNATDANWGGNMLFGQNSWEAFLTGVPLTGVLGNPALVDNTYNFGYNRLQGVVPFPSTGAFNGFSTAYLTAYASGGLFSNNFRDLPITAYAWQLATTTGGPNAWWEANGSGPNASNPWAGNHAGPQFGACPYGWPLSGQALALVHSIAAEGLTASGSSAPFTFSEPLYIGRGIPNAWVAAGQTIGVSNLTSSFNVSTSARSTYGVSLSITKPAAARIITVNLSGTLPGGPVLIQLPIFASVGVASVTGGSYNASTRTVTANSGATQIVITLNEGQQTTTPIAWYRFDETSGTTAADSSGNGRNATLVNGPTFVAGRVGNAVNLDGTNDQVSLPAGVLSSLNDFTIATWVKLDTTSAWRRVFDFGTGTTVNMFLTPQSSANTVRFAITTSGAGGEQRINGTSALPTGSWSHVAVTKSGNTGTLYVNGVQVGQNTNMTLSPSSLGNTTNNWIGRSQYADPFLDGQVDEFRIYNRALSASEVLSLFQNP